MLIFSNTNKPIFLPPGQQESLAALEFMGRQSSQACSLTRPSLFSQTGHSFFNQHKNGLFSCAIWEVTAATLKNFRGELFDVSARCAWELSILGWSSDLSRPIARRGVMMSSHDHGSFIFYFYYRSVEQVRTERSDFNFCLEQRKPQKLRKVITIIIIIYFLLTKMALVLFRSRPLDGIRDFFCLKRLTSFSSASKTNVKSTRRPADRRSSDRYHQTIV